MSDPRIDELRQLLAAERAAKEKLECELEEAQSERDARGRILHAVNEALGADRTTMWMDAPKAIADLCSQVAEERRKNDAHRHGWSTLAVRLLDAGFRGDDVHDGVSWLRSQVERLTANLALQASVVERLTGERDRLVTALETDSRRLAAERAAREKAEEELALLKSTHAKHVHQAADAMREAEAARERAERDAAGERDVRRQAEEQMNEAEAAHEETRRDLVACRASEEEVCRQRDAIRSQLAAATDMYREVRKSAGVRCLSIREHVFDQGDHDRACEYLREHVGDTERLTAVEERFDAIFELCERLISHWYVDGFGDVDTAGQQWMDALQKLRARADTPEFTDDALEQSRRIAEAMNPEWLDDTPERPDFRPRCVSCGKRWLPDEGIDAQETPCPSCAARSRIGVVQGTPEPEQEPPPPVPLILHCPDCRARHVDVGRFASHPHHTHSCQSCGLTWRPAVVPTVGVQFLPGFKDVPAPEVNDPRAGNTSTFATLAMLATDVEAMLFAVEMPQKQAALRRAVDVLRRIADESARGMQEPPSCSGQHDEPHDPAFVCYWHQECAATHTSLDEADAIASRLREVLRKIRENFDTESPRCWYCGKRKGHCDDCLAAEIVALLDEHVAPIIGHAGISASDRWRQWGERIALGRTAGLTDDQLMALLDEEETELDARLIHAEHTLSDATDVLRLFIEASVEGPCDGKGRGDFFRCVVCERELPDRNGDDEPLDPRDHAEGCRVAQAINAVAAAERAGKA